MDKNEQKSLFQKNILQIEAKIRFLLEESLKRNHKLHSRPRDWCANYIDLRFYFDEANPELLDENIKTIIELLKERYKLRLETEKISVEQDVEKTIQEKIKERIIMRC